MQLSCRHRADLWLAWSPFRICTPPSTMWSDTYLKPPVTVCWSELEELRWNLHLIISLEDSCVALFSVIKAWNSGFGGPFFCTRDEGDLFEYTTWSCTVTVQSLGQMFNDFCWHYCEMKVYVCLEMFCFFMCKCNCYAFLIISGHIKPSKLVYEVPKLFKTYI